jgi:hypothetical protein
MNEDIDEHIVSYLTEQVNNSDYEINTVNLKRPNHEQTYFSVRK